MAAQEHPAAEKIAAFAPGRIEVLGNHTDYNQGLVLGAAIDRGLEVSGNRRNDDSIRLHSQLTGAIEVTLSDLHPLAESSWGNYALGVVSELIQLGIPIGGFTAEVTGDLPAGSGLSSSAAFEIATALFLLKLSGRQLQPMEIAKACQRAEHHFVGVRSGLL